MGSRGWNGATVVLTPVFEKGEYSATVNVKDAGKGTAGAFSIGGETYRLAAMGADGYAFDYWLAGESSSPIYENPYTVTNFNTMTGDPNFTVEELSAIAFGYNRLLKESSDLLLDLKEVTTATGLSMTDKERLDIINRIYGEVLEYKNLTWYYTRKNIGVSYLRSKEKGDAARVLSLYGTHEQRYW